MLALDFGRIIHKIVAEPMLAARLPAQDVPQGHAVTVTQSQQEADMSASL
ncbi:hypothetical protein PPN31114_00164 [Pandoraea pneumonica]|uniref:Uncharacterized protein n=1 Tax=Pandoraea pneumonica TaxID=2508299 RepID=A0A5E4RGJ8_9BURK|nr:hypothetical protein PPN31114_00164 [Pandoraea pneumonica]